MNTTPGHFRDLMKQRLGFGAADFSCNLIWGITATYLMFFYTDVMGLAAADVALLFLLARLLDGAADVAVGLCIDKTHTRWGGHAPTSPSAPLRWECSRYCRSTARAFKARRYGPMPSSPI